MGKKTRKKFNDEDRIKVVQGYYESPLGRMSHERRKNKAAKKAGITPRTLDRWCKTFNDEVLRRVAALRKAEEKDRVEELSDAGLVLKCPQCGNDNDSNFQMWEDVIASRDVFGFNENGVLEISGSSSPGDDSENDRFVCMSCMKDFPIPDNIEIEYV